MSDLKQRFSSVSGASHTDPFTISQVVDPPHSDLKVSRRFHDLLVVMGAPVFPAMKPKRTVVSGRTFVLQSRRPCECSLERLRGARIPTEKRRLASRHGGLHLVQDHHVGKEANVFFAEE